MSATRAERRWLALFGGFAVAAIVVLALPEPVLGVRVLLLVVGFNVAVVWMARVTHDAVLWRAWTVLAGLSVFMVLPDWFLGDVLGSIRFADTGAPFVGAVPVFMAGMWTVALLPVALAGWAVDRRAGLGWATATAAATGMAVFVGAEILAPSIPLWEPIGVAMTAGLATYVLLPELVLSVVSFLLVRFADDLPTWAVVGGVVLLPFTYTGMLATSYQFLG